ncbi:MAG: hypothetical protein HZC28_10100 [Spirochaetes bacterium]|nr:hypothetical protein [Spirochaetota bacterium]
MKLKAIPLILSTLALAALPLQPQEIIKSLKIKKEGNIEIDVMRIGIQVYDDNWSMNGQGPQTVTFAAGYPKSTPASYELKGTFKHKTGATFALNERITKINDSSISFEASMNTPGAKLNSLALSVDIPADAVKGKAIMVDGQAVPVPLEFTGTTGVFSGEAKKIVIPLASGKLFFEGNVKIMLQDNRKWGPSFDLRIYFDNSAGEIKDAAIKLNMGYEPFESKPIDISAQANMGFRDETAGDTKGGWTDQGSENDLAALQTGSQIFCGLTFNIIDPAKNGGKSCLVFAGPDRGYFLKEAVIPGGGAQFNYLFLLHAIAWPPSGKEIIGRIAVAYEDGTTAEQAVTKGVDVANWWAPDDLTNGTVSWASTNKSSFVGLFVSKFKVENKPIKSISLVPTGKAVWMVAAMTGSPENVPLKALVPTYIAENDNWKPISGHAAVEKGSVLDFSFLVDGPAGKYGETVIRDGHFEFKNIPGQKVRFYGPNVCFSANYMEKPDCDALADLWVKTGYNCIRFHHYDRDYIDRSAADSVTAHAANVDKLDYLFHVMKQKGVYVTIDLFTIRPLKPNEIPEINGRVPEMNEYKALVRLLPSAMDNWKKYAALVLEHKNPYTGIAWKDDPALFSVCVLNEDALAYTWGTTPDSKRITLAAFDRWAKEMNLTWGTEAERSKIFMRFLVEMDIRMFKAQKEYLTAMGVKAHLTDANNVDTVPLAFFRNTLDFVDDHGYWDHMNFLEKQWSRPFQFGNKSVIPAMAAMPRGQMPVRIFGKPFTFTEFQYVCPNEYRSEGGTVFGAYAALQDWDGINRFAFSHSSKGIIDSNVAGAAGGFDLANEPISYLSEKIGLLFFLRGDVTPAKTLFPFVLTDNYLTAGEGMVSELWSAGFPSKYSTLGLFGQVGSFIAGGPASLPASAAAVGIQESINGTTGKTPYYMAGDTLIGKMLADGILPAANFDTNRNTIRSDTGQIVINGSNGTFSVVTGMSESFVLPDGTSLAGNIMSVKNEGHFATISAASVDGKKLADSSRILVTHLTDVKNSKIKFRNKAKTIEEEAGGPPMLVAYGKASITFTIANAASLKVFGCDISGRRIEEMKTQRSGGALSFTAETIRDGKAKYMVYEIAAK